MSFPFASVIQLFSAGPVVVAIGPERKTQALLEEMLEPLGLSGVLLWGRDPHGRPTLCINGDPVAFSRSYAGDLCALALARRGRVGIDLVAPIDGNPELLAAHFHPSEQSWLQALEGEGRNLAIYRCWAAKEAMLKALGLGIAFGLDGVAVVPEGDDGLRVTAIADQSAEGWNLEISSVEGVVLALAWAH